MNCKILKQLTKILFLIAMVQVSLTAQQTNTNVDNRLYPVMKLKVQGLKGLLGNIANSYDISLGLELASNEDSLKYYELDYKGGRLSDLMDQILRLANETEIRYQWKKNKDGSVLIFPKNSFRDSTLESILGTKINQFALKEQTTCDGIVKSIIDSQEVQVVLSANDLTHRYREPGGFYIQKLVGDFSFNVSDMTVQDILNKVIVESPNVRMWSIERQSLYPKTFTLAISASFNGSVVFDDDFSDFK
jgi:hypothetical protein